MSNNKGNEENIYLDVWKSGKAKIKKANDKLKESIVDSIVSNKVKKPNIQQEKVSIKANGFVKTIKSSSNDFDKLFITSKNEDKKHDKNSYDKYVHIEKQNTEPEELSVLELNFDEDLINHFDKNSSSKEDKSELLDLKYNDIPDLPNSLIKKLNPKPLEPLQSLDLIVDKSWDLRNSIGDNYLLIYNQIFQIIKNNDLKLSNNYFEELNNVYKLVKDKINSDIQIDPDSNLIKKLCIFFEKNKDFFQKYFQNNSNFYKKLIEKNIISIEDLGNYYFRFYNNNSNVINIKRRIFLSVKSEKVSEVTYFILSEILENKDQFPHIELIRVSGIQKEYKKLGNIEILISNTSVTDKIIEKLKSYSNKDYFFNEIPYITKYISRGISFSDEPVNNKIRLLIGDTSFAGLRAKIISKSLSESLIKNINKESFFDILQNKFKSVYVNVWEPNTNTLINNDKITSNQVISIFLKFLKGNITSLNDPVFFYDDIYYFILKSIEKENLIWLQSQLKINLSTNINKKNSKTLNNIELALFILLQLNKDNSLKLSKNLKLF